MQLVKNLIDEAHSAGADVFGPQKRTPEICVPEEQNQLKEILHGEESLIWNISRKSNCLKKIIITLMSIVEKRNRLVCFMLGFRITQIYKKV